MNVGAVMYMFMVFSASAAPLTSPCLAAVTSWAYYNILHSKRFSHWVNILHKHSRWARLVQPDDHLCNVPCKYTFKKDTEKQENPSCKSKNLYIYFGQSVIFQNMDLSHTHTHTLTHRHTHINIPGQSSPSHSILVVVKWFFHCWALSVTGRSKQQWNITWVRVIKTVISMANWG